MLVIAKHNKDETGGVLVATVILLTLVGFMGAAVLEQTNVDTSSNQNELQSSQALQIGNGGIQYALTKLDQGENPVVQNKPFALGNFSVTTIPATQNIFVTGIKGTAQKNQSLTANFSEQCVAEDEMAASSKNNGLSGIELFQSCHKRSVITSLKVEWNASNCAQNLSCGVPESSKQKVCHTPPGNSENQHTITINNSHTADHIAHGDTLGPCVGSENSPAPPIVCPGFTAEVQACGPDTNNANVKAIRIDNTWVVQNITAASGETIDIIDFEMLAGKTYEIDQIVFDSHLPDETWYNVVVNYADGSQETIPFTFDD